MKADWWVSSGLAADAAQGLAWFVLIVFIGIGVVMWDSTSRLVYEFWQAIADAEEKHKESKNADDDRC